MLWVARGALALSLAFLLPACGGRTELWLDSAVGESVGGGMPAIAGAGGGGSSGMGGASGCISAECGLHAECDRDTDACECSAGFIRQSRDEPCTAIACEFDFDCDDADPCNGQESCQASTRSCLPGEPFACLEREQCLAVNESPRCICAAGLFPNALGVCLPACEVPLAPVISVIAKSETLHFRVSDDSPIETAIQSAQADLSSAVYLPLADVSLTAHLGSTRVLARVSSPACTPVTVFDALYDVRETCAPSADMPGTTAVANNDVALIGWASAVLEYQVGSGVNGLEFMRASAALGPAEGNSFDVVSLGDGGRITLTFAPPIQNGRAWDFALFENGFNAAYLELAFVEVSSDGVNFLRFDSAFLGHGPAVGGYTGDARSICGLAGSYAAGFGTPFDLEALRNQPLARNGTVDLNSIRYVRVVDVVGDGNTYDSFGRPIFDPHPSGPSAGFDLDAIGALRAEQP